jgi:hypothetical protein
VRGNFFQWIIKLEAGTLGVNFDSVFCKTHYSLSHDLVIRVSELIFFIWGKFYFSREPE